MSVSLQIQAIIYHNETDSLMRTLDSVANAIRVDRENGQTLNEVVFHYGDASAKPVLSESDVSNIACKFEHFFTFRYTFFNENTGTSKGHNRLARTCTSDYTVVMNPDIIFCSRFFEKMLAPFMDETKNAGLTEARQLPLEHPKCFDRDTLETKWSAMACVMVPTALYSQLGGLDENTFFMYCDDVDYSWRTRLVGKKLYYRPDCPVFHAKRLSADAHWQPTNAERYYSQEAALLMAYKWSNDERFEELYTRFRSSADEIPQRIIRHFEQMKEEGRLPERLDPEHRIAEFVGDNYSEHKYLM